MMRFSRVVFVVLSLAMSLQVHAQQLDLIDPDEFVDPREIRGRTIFISRLVMGASRGSFDQYRRVGQDVGVIHLVNSLYWSGFQIDYKRSEVRGEHDPRPNVESPCNGTVGVTAFACLPARVDQNASPVPGAKNVVQLSWYQTVGDRITIRYRLVQARQYAVPETAAHIPGLKAYDDTRIAQIDTGVRVRGRTLSGYVSFTELTRKSAIDRNQQEMFILGAFLPLVSVGPAILTPRVQIAGITDVGPAIDVINPSLDLSWTIPHVDANVHVIYSPVFGDLGTNGSMNHQVAVYVDRAILVLPLRRRR